MKVGIVEGYLVDGSFTTRVHWDWQSPDSELPKEVVGTEDEKAEYSGEELYRTTDGRVFLSKETAEAHQSTITVPELDETIELLEKVKVLCETNKEKSPLFSTILTVLKEMDGDGGEAMLDKYYDSTCY